MKVRFRVKPPETITPGALRVGDWFISSADLGKDSGALFCLVENPNFANSVRVFEAQSGRVIEMPKYNPVIKVSVEATARYVLSD